MKKAIHINEAMQILDLARERRQTVNLKVWEMQTGNVIEYQGCSNLEEINVRGWKVTLSDFTNADRRNQFLAFMFYGCSRLASIDLSFIDTTGLTWSGATFSGTNMLVNSGVTHIKYGTSMFNCFVNGTAYFSLFDKTDLDDATFTELVEDLPTIESRTPDDYNTIVVGTTNYNRLNTGTLGGLNLISAAQAKGWYIRASR